MLDAAVNMKVSLEVSLRRRAVTDQSGEGYAFPELLADTEWWYAIDRQVSVRGTVRWY